MTKVKPKMDMKQNKTFFHGTYSNLTPYLFLSKNFKAFYSEHDYSELRQWKGNKIRHFSWDIFKSDIIFHCS